MIWLQPGMSGLELFEARMAHKKRTSKTSPKKRTAKKKTSRLTFWTKIKLGFCFCVVVLTGLSLIVVLDVLEPKNDRVRTAQAPDAVRKSDSKPRASSRAKSRPEPQNTAQRSKDPEIRRKVASGSDAARMYEEALQEELDQKIRQVDLALVQSLIMEGIDPERLQHEDVVQKSNGHQDYYYQSLVLNLDQSSQEAFFDRFRKTLEDWTEDVKLHQGGQGGRSWEILIFGLATHGLELTTPKAPKVQAQGTDKPRLCIVIDDLGEDLRKARTLIQTLGNKVTLSILPFSTHTDDIVRLGRAKGVDIMLHLPMEPKGYPDANPGPGGLFVAMGMHELQEVLQKDFRQVPGLVGVNNHMGSRFTADVRGMDVVLQEVKNRGLFFMDSLTSPESVARDLGRRMGVPVVSRDIFIDNEQREEAILFQLQKAEQLARKIGRAVAIGHPYPETLRALQTWSAKRDGRVELCRVSELVM